MATSDSKGLVEEFKEFIATGNLLQIAVAFVMGAATAAVVESFVKNIFNGLLGAILGSENGTGLAGRFAIWNGNIRIGAFIDDVLAFLVLAVVVFFLVKAANRFLRQQFATATPPDLVLLAEIRDLLKSSAR